ncbi:MAG TPA: cupin domain-containing protein [Acidobacteriaceae bacterium]
MAEDTTGNTLAASRVYAWDGMKERINANGSKSRDVLHGQLPTGEWVRVHQTTQPAGLPPNPAHVIQHTEVICIREGTVEFTHDGQTGRASAGELLLVAKGSLHGLRNVGDGPASYFVVAVGGDVQGGSK